MLYIIVLIIQLLLATFIFFLTISFVTGAPFVPSVRPAARIMIDLAAIKNGDIVYDLGSGDGRILFLAARRGGNARGFEINPFLVFFTLIRVFFSPYRTRIKVSWKNFWNADFHDADVVFFYLLPWRMRELKDKLTSELKPGTRIVSNSFIFPNWKPLRYDKTNHVYLYVAKADVI